MHDEPSNRQVNQGALTTEGQTDVNKKKESDNMMKESHNDILGTQRELWCRGEGMVAVLQSLNFHFFFSV